MSLPKRQYAVARKRGRTTKFFYGVLLKDALALAKLRDGEEFSYTLYEGQNQVECVVTKLNPLHFAERGK